jgi:hypothetical protein
MTETARHRLVRTVLSLRELRLMILEVLGPSERISHAPRPSSALPDGNGHENASGNGHGKQHTEQANVVDERETSGPVAREQPSSIGNGDQA